MKTGFFTPFNADYSLPSFITGVITLTPGIAQASADSPIPEITDPVVLATAGLCGALGYSAYAGVRSMYDGAKSVLLKKDKIPILQAGARRFRNAALLVAATGLAAEEFAVQHWQERVVPHGEMLAHEALTASAQKLAVEISVRGDAGKTESIGYAYGQVLGQTNENVNGVDRSILINPDMLKRGGKLYHWYEALKYLEDREHESGHSEKTGINSRMARAPIKAVGDYLSGRKIQGASSIADQTCGALEDHVADRDKILTSYQGSLVDQLPQNYQKVVREKLHDTFCGVGLAQLKSPHEIAALYASFGYLANGAEGVELFVRNYWGLESTDDARLTRGQQIVMAAMLRYPFKYSANGDNWPFIEDRARYALNGLRATGVIADTDFDEIGAEISAARPQEKSRTENMRYDPLYEYPVRLALAEARQKYGDEYRLKVAKIELAIEAKKQGALHREGEKALRDLPYPGGVSMLGVIQDDAGFISAIETGMLVTSTANTGQQDSGGRHEKSEQWLWQTGEVDRYRSTLQVGSLGKALLVVGASHYFSYGTAHDETEFSMELLLDIKKELAVYNSHYLFLHSLRVSHDDIIYASSRLGIRDNEIMGVINCFGSFKTGNPEPLRDAATGVFATTPEVYVPLLGAIATGRFYRDPHVVSAYVLRDGSREDVTSEILDFPDTPDCNPAGFTNTDFGVYVHNPMSVALMQEPLYGTLADLNGLVDMGKTGTVGSADSRSNNRSWIMAGWYEDDAQAVIYNADEKRGFTTVLFTIGDDDNVSTPVRGLGTAGQELAPRVADLVREIR